MPVETEFSTLLAALERASAPGQAIAQWAEWLTWAGSKAMAVVAVAGDGSDEPAYFFAHDQSDSGFAAHMAGRFGAGKGAAVLSEVRSFAFGATQSFFNLAKDMPHQYPTLRRTTSEAFGFGFTAAFGVRTPLEQGEMGVMAVAGDTRILAFEEDSWRWMLEVGMKVAVTRELQISQQYGRLG